MNGDLVVPGQYITPIYKRDGDVISQFIAGPGTVVTDVKSGENSVIKVISSTILGKIHTEATPEEKITKSVVSVLSTKNNSYRSSDTSNDRHNTKSSCLPSEGDIVLVKITRIGQRQANCELLTVESLGNILPDSGVGANGDLAHGSVTAGGGSQALTSHQTIASSQTSGPQAVGMDLGEGFKGIIRSQDVRSTDRDKVKIVDSFRPGDIVRCLIISLGDGQNYYMSTARNDLGVVFAQSMGGAGDVMFPLDWQSMVDRTGVVEQRKVAKPFIE
ncbi:exosome 3'-_5 exonuclease subunit ski4 (Csl4) [Scheffersomyces spartinae]|uniref:Exosome 3'->5 exonuclease subunit ski4 (Csl4) n=1 Tax=Scheffersomyces spartinae TaxID=45513 RepID=A0A9P7VCG0_9ASCO|nr:exosome 3'->5 exonuclease subunit ski4 (Csl4) [Scheffersomyces spartinae]KAG7195553.1 exosome 3'->5 exonuclease subunit ski4 (Csl4) [Scheffersomyces spartinae]